MPGEQVDILWRPDTDTGQLDLEIARLLRRDGAPGEVVSCAVEIVPGDDADDAGMIAVLVWRSPEDAWIRERDRLAAMAMQGLVSRLIDRDPDAAWLAAEAYAIADAMLAEREKGAGRG